MSKRIKNDVEVIETRERAEEVAGEIAAATINQDAIRAMMDARIQAIRDEYELELLACALILEQNMPAMQAWAEAHPDLFPEKKSLDMVHAKVGFRIGMPKCKTLRGFTWEKVKALLVNRNLGYTRTTVEVDKEALIADRDKLGADGLSARGVCVTQDETFFLEPKREEVPA